MKKTLPNKESIREPSAAERRFESVIKALIGERGITQSRMFGSTGLTIHGKVFVILYKGRLVLKLPKDHVETLVQAGQGDYFDPGHGRISKGWVSIKPEAQADWLSLSQEAKAFVASVR
jgi:TfoX/Sxy family transcriptional regulator of competence genes